MLLAVSLPAAAFAALLAAGAALGSPGGAGTLQSPMETVLDSRSFRVLEGHSGPVDYYRIVSEGPEAFIRGLYHPPLETVTLAVELPDGLRQHANELRWRWRALVLPRGGNECVDGRGDSAASVYVTWKRGLRWYVLKYVWSSVVPRGTVCDRRRNLFLAQDTVVLESGEHGAWKQEQIDIAREFREHFEGGDPRADVPEVAGIGLMSDGDQTRSVSAADYAAFTIISAAAPRLETARTGSLPEAQAIQGQEFIANDGS
jgi:Protein of unknown function (DUF3047)